MSQGQVAPWIERFVVRSYEADAAGFATPASLCNYLQEAAGNHAFALDFSVEQLQTRGLTWMLSRLRLETVHMPRWRETVEVETWPSGTRGLLAMRDFLIRSSSGDELGRATTAWLLIDLERRRPARLTEELLALRLPSRPPALPPATERLSPPDVTTEESTVLVRWSDMDVNEHVNNVRYVAWAMDALPEETLRTKVLSSLAVDFLGETRTGDQLLVRTELAQREGNTVRSEIVSGNDSAPVARIATTWRGRS